MSAVGKQILMLAAPLWVVACGGGGGNASVDGDDGGSSDESRIEISSIEQMASYSPAELKVHFDLLADDTYTESREFADANLSNTQSVADYFVYDDGLTMIYKPRYTYNDFVWQYLRDQQQVGETISQLMNCAESGTVFIEAHTREDYSVLMSFDFDGCQDWDFSEYYYGKMYVDQDVDGNESWYYDETSVYYPSYSWESDSDRERLLTLTGTVHRESFEDEELYMIRSYQISIFDNALSKSALVSMEENFYQFPTSENRWGRSVTGQYIDSEIGRLDVSTTEMLDFSSFSPEDFGEIKFTGSGNRSSALEFRSGDDLYKEDVDGDGVYDVGIEFTWYRDLFDLPADSDLQNISEF